MTMRMSHRSSAWLHPRVTSCILAGGSSTGDYYRRGFEMTIDHMRMVRVLIRCGDLATPADVDPSVRRVYQEKLASFARTYLGANTALASAETNAKEERREAIAALEVIEAPYMKARAVAVVYVPELSVPDTLKTCPTDTDRVIAIQSLRDTLDDFDDEPGWAQDLTNPADPNSFGALADTAIREINEGVGADSAVEKARRERAAAYGPAYEAYLGFKNVVRNTYGRSSIQYRRIHIRRNGKLVIEDE